MPFVGFENQSVNDGLVFDQIIIFVQINFFVFQSSHEALGLSISIRVPLSAHADQDAVLNEQICIFTSGILDAAAPKLY